MDIAIQLKKRKIIGNMY